MGFRRLKLIDKDLFKYVPSLEWITLKQNSIKFIELGAFSYVPRLKQLDLGLNKLENCPRIGELTDLQVLRLNDNQIEFLDQSFFGDAINTKLRILDLNNNKLSTLNGHVFAPFVSLFRLELGNNCIVKISEDAFAGLVNLRTLNLSYNQLKSIELSVLHSDLANLRFLNLNSFCLTTVGVAAGFSGTEFFKRFRRHPVDIEINRPCLTTGGGVLDELANNGLVHFI
jgi:Leucine-rich repeat (LRR) protein